MRQTTATITKTASRRNSEAGKELAKPAEVFIKRTGETKTIERFCLDQVFDLLELISDEEMGLGEVLDMLAGDFDSAMVAEANGYITRANEYHSLAELQDDNTEQREALLEAESEALEMAANLRQSAVVNNFSLPKLIRIMSKRRTAVYEILALALQSEVEWPGKNLDLEEMLDIIHATVKQEFTTSFFVKLQSFGDLWRETKQEMGSEEPESPTPGAGPGPSQANLDRPILDSPTRA